ncbi:hypothetical protein CDL12_30461 [Handroanthus impetiginosus]|uniref:Uncharacterized protein n=1 Tax=Handroanthus impetiginosus TaxID=429701 RepID=A0A2G9FVF3_9LAMI|nr:hypothetical protein CDL12_30461 [Handroanthus impetiginosus]
MLLVIPHKIKVLCGLYLQKNSRYKGHVEKKQNLEGFKILGLHPNAHELRI